MPTVNNNITTPEMMIKIDRLGIVRKKERKDLSRKPVTPVSKDNTRDLAGPDWLSLGNSTLKDEEKSILYLPNAWLNDHIIEAVQEMLKRQFPHIWRLETCLKASNLTFLKV